MTWGELRDAIEAYGVRADERIVGIRLRSDGGRVGIRRTRQGIEIANVGQVAWLVDPEEIDPLALPPDVGGTHP